MLILKRIRQTHVKYAALLCLRCSFAVKPFLLPSGTIGSTEVERRIIGGRREEEGYCILVKLKSYCNSNFKGDFEKPIGNGVEANQKRTYNGTKAMNKKKNKQKNTFYPIFCKQM